MKLDSILGMRDTALVPVAIVVLLAIVIIGSILMSYFVDSLAKATACAALLAMICLGAGWAVSASEGDRVTEAREEVADGFDQRYGLKLDDRDLAALKRVEEDVTRDLESTAGDLKHVLFRVVDDVVLPHTLNSEGSWIPLPAQQNTGEAHTVAPYSKESNER